MAVMEFANVSFRYPTSKEQVLKEVSFQVQKGEFIVLCGASGSGKTTLLKHMIKSQIPIGIGSGSMYFAGADIETMDDRVAASQIAYVGQDPEHNMVRFCMAGTCFRIGESGDECSTDAETDCGDGGIFRVRIAISEAYGSLVGWTEAVGAVSGSNGRTAEAVSVR